MNQSVRLLIVDDNEDDALLMARRFRPAGYDPKFTRVDTAEAMTAALGDGPWDAIVADVTMPRFSAAAALEVYQRAGLDVPFLVVSGTIGEEKAVGLLKAGAHDFLLKSSLARLVSAFERERREATLRVAHRDADEARRLTEERLRRTNDKLEAAIATKSRFLAAASHDLRQPLQALFCFAGVLAEQVSGDAVATLHALDGALDTLKELLDALLDVSKLDAGLVSPSPSRFPVATVIERVFAEMAPAASAAGISLRMVRSTAIVESDPVLLGRILRNLVENAIRYTKRGGVLIGCRRRGRGVALGVWDTGIGIPDDCREHIFDEFYQVGNAERDRRKGLGLGLAIVSRLCALLGHRCEVSSVPNRGSAFLVTLPAQFARRTTAPTGGAAPVREPPGTGLIMVVDDEAMVASAMASVIGTWGFEVEVADSVEGAAATASRLAASSRQPRAIVADYRLGGGRTGTEAIDAIRAACGSRIPGVVVTGDTAAERLREIEMADATVLYKPVTPRELRRVLTSITAAEAVGR